MAKGDLPKYSSLNEVLNVIDTDFNPSNKKDKDAMKNICVDILYAFNGTGKTRLSRMMTEKYKNVLCFNSLFQDDFIWDNNDKILNIRNKSWIVDLINDLEIQQEIINNFKKIYGNNIEPEFNENSNQITFSAITKTGSDHNVKISKAEETIFIWSIYYTFLIKSIDILSISQDDRAVNNFDNLKYIIIDDPVSSVDDNLILKIALSINYIVEEAADKENIKLNFFITSHHALFYNTLKNMFKDNKKIKRRSYVLSTENFEYELNGTAKALFGYHLTLFNKIDKAVSNNLVEKIHFNMFRIILEKTANYFKYPSWDCCIKKFEHKKEIVRLLNEYSHGDLPQFECTSLTQHQKEIFMEAFNNYKEKYAKEK